MIKSVGLWFLDGGRREPITRTGIMRIAEHWRFYATLDENGGGRPGLAVTFTVVDAKGATVFQDVAKCGADWRAVAGEACRLAPGQTHALAVTVDVKGVEPARFALPTLPEWWRHRR